MSQTALEPLNTYLTARIPEISAALASIFMLLGGDYVIGRFILRRIRKYNILVRTALFSLYAILLLPLLIVVITTFFTTTVLEPFQDSLLPVLALSFFLVGILLTLRYHMKWR